MSSFSPWGGLGEPGEACVKCGGKETSLGAHAPTRGASQKGKQRMSSVRRGGRTKLTKGSEGLLLLVT
jgi:hypothetical protein